MDMSGERASAPSAVERTLRDIDEARVRLALSHEDLWRAYSALGGGLSCNKLIKAVTGKAPLDDLDHDIVVRALNDRLDQSGMAERLPYADRAIATDLQAHVLDGGDTPLTAVVLETDTEVEVHLAGEIDLGTRGLFQRTIDDAAAHRRPIVIDMTRVSFLDSTGLGVLAGARRDRVDIRLRGVAGAVRHALEVSGLDVLIPIEP